MRNLQGELENWNGYPPAWIPKPEDILVGFLESYDIGYTRYGEVRTVMVAEENTGDKWSIWLSSTVLLSLFDKHKPRPGERIGLKYLGKDPEKGYHKYRLLVDRPAEAQDFSALGGEEDDRDADVPL
jgi:hypothetical protein